MPNGTDPMPHADITAFEPYTKELENFAKSHALTLEKFYHNVPLWIIKMERSVSEVNVLLWSIHLYYYDGEFSLMVAAWLDTYQGDPRVLYRYLLPLGIVIKSWPRTQNVQIKKHLEKALKTALAIKREQLSRVEPITHGPYSRV